MSVRSRNLFDPRSNEPYALSRSRLELFLQCPRCFWLDRRAGIDRIGSPPYTLNLSVDVLLKREFDRYRAEGTAHPLMTRYGMEAVPLKHPQLDAWRDMRSGMRFLHPTGLLIFGAVDDVWVEEGGRLIIVDYKATASAGPVRIESAGRASYRRQLDIYRWLFKQNGFRVSDRACFVFAVARSDQPAFNARLDFSLQIHSYESDDSWVDDAVTEAHRCLCDAVPPPYVETCAWCAYRRAALQHEGNSAS